jgi:hypothetical protein
MRPPLSRSQQGFGQLASGKSRCATKLSRRRNRGLDSRYHARLPQFLCYVIVQIGNPLGFANCILCTNAGRFKPAHPFAYDVDWDRLPLQSIVKTVASGSANLPSMILLIFFAMNRSDPPLLRWSEAFLF